jgi:hypothetical protein
MYSGPRRTAKKAGALLLEALAVGDVAHEGLPAAVGQDGGAYLSGEG